MASPAVSLKVSPWLRPRTVLWALIGLMFAYVLYHNERFLVDMKDPNWAHIATFKWYLLPHGLAGACALLLGPMQFFDSFRQRHLKLHRVVGRFYIFGALVAGPVGVYIQYFQERTMGVPRSFTIVAGVQALLWATTTLIALAFALKRKITLHRQWMTRSYAVALVFLEVRLISGIGGWDSSIAAGETIVWICNAFALLLADVVLQWQDFRAASRIA